VGLRQYERLQFTDGQPWFKSAIFMYRANHGQWNSVWENKDNGPRSGRSLELDALIDPEAQRQMAKVVISGFLEATLHGKREYVPMFRDHRTAGAWLPKTMYTTKFQESGFHALASFDRDVDLTTGSAKDVVLAGEHLSAWKEDAVPFRGRGGDNQNHNAVTIGWNNRYPVTPEAREAAAIAAARARMAARASGAPAPAETDPKGEPAPPASYSISVPAAVRSDWGVGAASAVYVSLAATSTKPGPRALPKDPNKKPEDEKAATTAKPPARPAPRPPPRKNVEPDTTPIDLTVELVDTAGHVVRLPLSQFGIARKPLDARIYRRAGRDAARFSTIYELIPQTFVMPMSDFVATSPAFDPRQLATVRLVFDKTDAGTIVLEHVGLSTPVDPAFLSAPVR
jgi:hypothetical protein